jgi:hypothetical protein
MIGVRRARLARVVFKDAVGKPSRVARNYVAH